MNVETDVTDAGQPRPTVPAERPAGRRLRAALALTCWLYAAVVIAVAIALPLLGDRWWVATLLMFGARWPWAAPLVLLAPLAVLFRRRSLYVLTLAAIVALFGILSFRLPWRNWLDRPAANPGVTLRVVTWNIHSCYALDTPAAARWLADQHADVIAFEEWPRGRPIDWLVGDGWNVLHDGELCVLSRLPLRRATRLSFGPAFAHGSGSRYLLSTAAGEIPLAALHLASPHDDFSVTLQREPAGPARVQRNSARRFAQADEVSAWCRDLAGPRAIVMGDLNTPSDSPVFRTLERGNLSDAFLSAGLGFGWTYRHRFALARIDHVMFGRAWSCDHCTVGPEMGSPHRPVMAELRLHTQK